MTATLLQFAPRKPARRLSDRACDKLREAKTAELVNEQINRDWIRGFFAEMEDQRIWDDAVRAFVGERV